MTIEGLSYIKECMNDLNIPYQYMEWNGKIPRMYFVGEDFPVPNEYENGLIESTFTLKGTTKQKYIDLKIIDEKVRDFFTTEGRTAILSDGTGIAVCYSTSNAIPAIEEGVHRIEINLNVKEYRGK